MDILYRFFIHFINIFYIYILSNGLFIIHVKVLPDSEN